MGYARKTDKNQKEIVGILRQAGFSVFVLARVGEGFPDLCAARNRTNYLIEVKSKNGRFTHDQKSFAASWKGQLAKLETLEDVQRFAENPNVYPFPETTERKRIERRRRAHRALLPKLK